jgi:hypothetical protein
MIWRTDRAKKALTKKAKKGFAGYPVATVGLYGPTDKKATKVVLGIIAHEGAEAEPMRKWSLKLISGKSTSGRRRRWPSFARMSKVGRHDRPHHRLPSRGRYRLSRRAALPSVSFLGEQESLVWRDDPVTRMSVPQRGAWADTPVNDAPDAETASNPGASVEYVPSAIFD